MKADTTGSSNEMLVLPKPPDYPIVVWSKTDECFDPRTIVPEKMDKYIKECMNWPIKTDTLCHHCCHTFTTIPVPLPYSYDKVRGIYKCRGIFCSWQCVKAYNMDSIRHIGRGEVNTNIALLAYRLWVKYLISDGKEIADGLRDYTRYSITSAGRKSSLKHFGGDKTIEEYRKGSFGIIPPSEALSGKPFIGVKGSIYLPFSTTDNIEVDRVADHVNPGNMMNTMVTSAVHKHANEFCEKLNKAKQEKSVIKRKRADSTKNTLISSMGVKVAQRKR